MFPSARPYRHAQRQNRALLFAAGQTEFAHISSPHSCLAWVRSSVGDIAKRIRKQCRAAADRVGRIRRRFALHQFTDETN